MSAPQLAAPVLLSCLASAGVHPGDVDELVLGHVLQSGVGQAPARQASILAGLPKSVVCSSINKVCASGMKAITAGSQSILLGVNDICLVGGMECMSTVPHYVQSHRRGRKLGHDTLTDGLIHDGLWCADSHQHMGNCAEKTARDMQISRGDQDSYAAESARRSKDANASGAFRSEIVPVRIGGSGPSPRIVSTDEQLAKLNADKLTGLKPAFDKCGSITAGNASPISDGAAAVLLMSSETVKARNIVPIARIIGWADGERDPVDFAIAPSIAIQRALPVAGVGVNDIDLWEINEAFAVVVLANCKMLNIPLAKVNVLGGAISLGHPLGCSGARIVCTLLTAMKLKGAKLGCAAICNGGGGATAIVVRVD